MSLPARKFKLQETRSKHGLIVDAYGSIGFWPFRRPISYHVGVNCDAISVHEGEIQVQRRGHVVAVAALIGT